MNNKRAKVVDLKDKNINPGNVLLLSLFHSLPISLLILLWCLLQLHYKEIIIPLPFSLGNHVKPPWINPMGSKENKQCSETHPAFWKAQGEEEPAKEVQCGKAGYCLYSPPMPVVLLICEGCNTPPYSVGCNGLFFPLYIAETSLLKVLIFSCGTRRFISLKKPQFKLLNSSKFMMKIPLIFWKKVYKPITHLHS